MTVTVPEIDLVTAEVIRSAMETVCFEMATFVSRTATTPILNQSNERNATILDWQGRLAALSVGIPQFMLSAHACPSRFAIDFFGDELQPGDVIVANDPYHGGGHLPDFNVFAPVFHTHPDGRTELLLIASIQCHHGDTGGAMAGGYNIFAKDIYSEGTRYPLLKIIDAGQGTARRRAHHAGQQPPRRASSATSAPRSAPPSSGVERLSEIVDRYGADAVKAAVDYTIDDARRRFTNEIAGWPDGTYEADIYVDATRRATGTSTSTGRHRRRRPADPRLRGFRQPPGHRRLVHLRQHPGQRHRPAGEPGRPVDPEEPGILRVRRAARPPGLLPQPGGGQAGELRARTIPVSRWATPSPSPCPRSSPTAAPPRPTSSAAPARCGATSTLGPASPFFDHGGETNAGWVNAVEGVDGWGAPASAMGNLIKASAEINETLFPHFSGAATSSPIPVAPGSSGAGAAVTSSRRCATPDLRQPVRRQPAPHPSRASPGAPWQPGYLLVEPGDRTKGRRCHPRSPDTCSRRASSSSTTSAGAAAGATRLQRDPGRCSTTSGTSTSRSKAPGATTAWSSPDRSRRMDLAIDDEATEHRSIRAHS